MTSEDKSKIYDLVEAKDLPGLLAFIGDLLLQERGRLLKELSGIQPTDEEPTKP